MIRAKDRRYPDDFRHHAAKLDARLKAPSEK
jgi:hypothetical protein